jgi:NADPH-dependent 2,4-dienoyl-CoA reductase/sulfur reductase-like enzyme/rhodanese-related sulfurtransferase
MPKKVIIVGGVAGGMSAATRLRRLDEFAEITVFERGPFVSFANCGLPYHIGGEIADRAKLLVQTPERLREVFQLDVRANCEVTSIDRKKKTVTAKNLLTGETTTHTYDNLILATGAKAVKPELPGIDRAGLYFLRTIPEMDAILAWLTEHDAKKAVIVGGGYIGLEAAEQLHRRGLQVSIVQQGDQVLTALDRDMAVRIHEELAKHGVALHLGQPVIGFAGPTENAKACVVQLEGGTELPADVVILAMGVKPEITLAKAAGLKIGKAGGIEVDDSLQTSDKRIYAVGDAVEVEHGVLGDYTLIALAGPANRMGRVAADNICGRESGYYGTYGSAIVRVFDIVAACTGANEKLLKQRAKNYQALHLHPNSHAGYYPGAKSIALKVLFDPQTGEIYGAQAVGEDGIDKRIDVIATAMQADMKVYDLADLELCYAPPFGSAKDPINLIGMAAQNIMMGLVEVAQWHEVTHLVEAGAGILDVRDTKEFTTGAIPGSIHITLGELRSRLGELAKDRTWLVHCASGQRSYNACRVLMQRGYQCKNLTGSYKTWAVNQTK